MDHEHVLDSDSILSLAYLPRSLAVLGGGVIASEYASVMSQLGVAVTMVDRAPRPLAFLDPELSSGFVASFQAGGGRYLAERKVLDVAFDGVSRVVATLDDGSTVETEKVLVALGRTGCLDGLGLDAAGLEATPRGTLDVDACGRTAAGHIYAVGDVAGPPALAASAMEQGRRAACHALGRDLREAAHPLPIGIYTIPEIASVGLAEPEAGDVLGCAPRIGRARFREVARGHIAGVGDGLLKLVADPAGGRLLGIQIIGEGATELIHVGQMALVAGLGVEDLIDTIFNFPTLAEAYRIAALDVANGRPAS